MKFLQNIKLFKRYFYSNSYLNESKNRLLTQYYSDSVAEDFSKVSLGLLSVLMDIYSMVDLLIVCVVLFRCIVIAESIIFLFILTIRRLWNLLIGLCLMNTIGFFLL